MNTFKTPVLFSVILIVLTIPLISSCKDDDSIKPAASRKVKYELFTTSDFSQETDIITFEARIVGKKVIWDSVLAPMQIKDIPSAVNKIVFEKEVPEDDNSELTVGFKYTIEGVGISWHNERLLAGEELKVVSFDFQ